MNLAILVLIPLIGAGLVAWIGGRGRLRSAYSTRVIKDYLAFIYAGDGWDKALTDYATDIVLIHSQ